MLGGILARIRSLWLGVRRSEAVDAEMQEEFRLHLELRAADLVRAGLSAEAATRQARLEFGSPAEHADEGRAARGLRPIDDLRLSWLDFKIGARMLVKYPALTLVGGLALAFAIAIGAGTFELVRQLVWPALPLPDGNRIVALRNWDVAGARVDRQALHDLARWRAQLRAVEELGAWRDAERNLTIGKGPGEPLQVAEISASAFRLTRVAPLLGRGLGEGDERPGAASVVVIGYDVWRSRFAGDRGVVGRAVRLGADGTPTTVVGVMPPGYAFPVSHGAWTPLRLEREAFAPGEGPELAGVFGRLAPGATLAGARAQLVALGAQAAREHPGTHRDLRPQVMPFAHSVLRVSPREAAVLGSVNLFVVMLLVLVGSNVALLVFARAATREGEIVVRNALGASRGRIVMQLFAEGLVLSAVAAGAGLGATRWALRWALGIVEAGMGTPPFWIRPALSPATLLYAGVLTLLAAGLAGVVPALKLTAKGAGVRLRQLTAGGGGLKMGRLWTAVIVSQIAATLAFPTLAYMTYGEMCDLATVEVGLPAEEYLTAALKLDAGRDAGEGGDAARAAFAARFGTSFERLARRLEEDPHVLGVTYADRLPRMFHPHRLVEVDGGGAAPLHSHWPEGYRVSSAEVDPRYFEVVGAPILAGRDFRAADAGQHVVVVNQSFVERVLGGRNAIGRHLRFILYEEWVPRRVDRSGPWHQIVGVVPDMGMSAGDYDPKVAGIYQPAGPAAAYPLRLAVHLKGAPGSFAPKLREIAGDVDPGLSLDDVSPMDQLSAAEMDFLHFWLQVLATVSAIGLVLSLSGIYAVMALNVAKRRREIGVRVALGAGGGAVVAAIAAPSVRQVALGIFLGAALTAALVLLGNDGAVSLQGAALVAGYAVLMLAICLSAIAVPTRRALRVQPTEALRSDG